MAHTAFLRFPEMVRRIPCKANVKFWGRNEEGREQRPSRGPSNDALWGNAVPWRCVTLQSSVNTLTGALRAPFAN